MKSIIVRITALDDEYDDVHPQCLLEDAINTPEWFRFELLDEPVDALANKEQKS